MKSWKLIGTTKKIIGSISATIFASELQEEQDHVFPEESWYPSKKLNSASFWTPTPYPPGLRSDPVKSDTVQTD